MADFVGGGASASFGAGLRRVGAVRTTTGTSSATGFFFFFGL
jgi:hypothetical protein